MSNWQPKENANYNGPTPGEHRLQAYLEMKTFLNIFRENRFKLKESEIQKAFSL